MDENTLRISMVVAAAENNAIGKNNELLWKLSADLRFFKHLTWAMPVVMGRKTFESVGKPLNGRINIVITRQQGWEVEGVVTAYSLEDALKKALDTDCREVFIAGGAEIYQLALPLTHKIYLTRVHAEPAADAFFPEFDSKEWKRTSATFHPKDGKNEYDFTFETWEKP